MCGRTSNAGADDDSEVGVTSSSSSSRWRCPLGIDIGTDEAGEADLARTLASAEGVDLRPRPVATLCTTRAPTDGLVDMKLFVSSTSSDPILALPFIIVIRINLSGFSVSSELSGLVIPTP